MEKIIEYRCFKHAVSIDIKLTLDKVIYIFCYFVIDRRIQTMFYGNES